MRLLLSNRLTLTGAYRPLVAASVFWAGLSLSLYYIFSFSFALSSFESSLGFRAIEFYGLVSFSCVLGAFLGSSTVFRLPAIRRLPINCSELHLAAFLWSCIFSPFLLGLLSISNFGDPLGNLAWLKTVVTLVVTANLVFAWAVDSRNIMLLFFVAFALPLPIVLASENQILVIGTFLLMPLTVFVYTRNRFHRWWFRSKPEDSSLLLYLLWITIFLFPNSLFSGLPVIFCQLLLIADNWPSRPLLKLRSWRQPFDVLIGKLWKFIGKLWKLGCSLIILALLYYIFFVPLPAPVTVSEETPVTVSEETADLGDGGINFTEGLGISAPYLWLLIILGVATWLLQTRLPVTQAWRRQRLLLDRMPVSRSDSRRRLYEMRRPDLLKGVGLAGACTVLAVALSLSEGHDHLGIYTVGLIGFVGWVGMDIWTFVRWSGTTKN